MFRTARLKLDRAGQLIAKYDDDLNAFSRDYIRPHAEGKSNPIFWSVVMRRPFPDELMLTVGDALHNMRSALDHMVWEMVHRDLEKRKRHICNRIKFPCHDISRDEFEMQIDRSTLGYEEPEGRDFKKRQPPFMDRGTATFIKMCEPYPGGAGAWLYDLHRLDIEDKHASIPTTIASIHVPSMVAEWPPGDAIDPVEYGPLDCRLSFSSQKDVALSLDAAYGIAALPQTSRRPEIHFRQGFVLNVMFKNFAPFGGFTISQTLARFTVGVSAIIDQAERFGLGYMDRREVVY